MARKSAFVQSFSRIGVFGVSAGLCAALITSFTVLPSLLPQRLREVPFRARLVQRLGQWFDQLQRARSRLWILPGAALLIVAIGLPRLKNSEDATMGQLDPELVAEDARVRGELLVSYQSQPLLGLLVPIELRERYTEKAPPARLPVITGRATYSNFRRFDVSVDQKIGPIQ